MAVSLSQLQALVALADAKTFSSAARRLRVTQPAVTQHIANLSREYGVALVESAGRRAVLTEAGSYLAARARGIAEAVDALRVDMREFQAAAAGTLRVGATLTIGTYVAPDLLAAFARSRPQMAIDVRIGNTAAIASMLRTHELGLALVEGVIRDEEIVTMPFASDELVLVAPPGSPFAAASPAAADLAGVPFVSREPGSGTRDLGYDALTRTGVQPRIVLELPSAEGILRAVQAGLGVAILSQLAVRDAAASGAVRIVRIADLPLTRSLFIAATRGRTLSPAQRAFARVVLGKARAAAAFDAAVAGTRKRSAQK